MVDVNAPIEQAPAVAPPTRTDEQILPRIRWVPIEKSNYYLDAEKSQSNPIYKIVVDILKHTNFFREFTASSTIPANVVSGLGYPKEVKHLSNVVTNDIFFGVSSIELISIMRKGCGKNSLNPSILSRKTKRIWHNDQRLPFICLLKNLFWDISNSVLKEPKGKIFGMPIPNELITDDIRRGDYYDAYLEKVAKHQRYLAGEEVREGDSPN
ncbi:hypothetical protein Tco_1495931 [Tanacetum coccineum]